MAKKPRQLEELAISDPDPWYEEASQAGIEGLSLSETVRGIMHGIPDFLTIPDPIVVVSFLIMYRQVVVST